MFVSGVVKTLGDGVSHGKGPICQIPVSALCKHWGSQGDARSTAGDLGTSGRGRPLMPGFGPSCRQEAHLAMGLREAIFPD
ncbi:hypothetical protein I603_1514 [Erythrobacter dokdonensis DSW-74]|uniref:Uncharacterized protein n=1 Tax=Erythrobacter dokdonensis DSW-74 TaxID=1300349 RepID=A0A1A7BHB1_9SPHN|nr:hypothetical protein I603_1514 [Erythrobacter dokdonensis DSW-74]